MKTLKDLYLSQELNTYETNSLIRYFKHTGKLNCYLIRKPNKNTCKTGFKEWLERLETVNEITIEDIANIDVNKLRQIDTVGTVAIEGISDMLEKNGYDRLYDITKIEKAAKKQEKINHMIKTLESLGYVVTKKGDTHE